MYSEEDFFQLSALQHYLFCPRQCALAYMELNWFENELTVLGHLLHKKAHEETYEKRGDLIRARGLRLSSARLGLSGQTDIVEFHRCSKREHGITLPGHRGKWRPYPVEYKLGKPKADHSDEVQLCAQAICLEEMLDTEIAEGAIFYGKKKRRVEVTFNSSLRGLTENTARKIHDMLATARTPAAIYSKKCKSCSLLNICMPKKTGGAARVNQYVTKIIDEYT